MMNIILSARIPGMHLVMIAPPPRRLHHLPAAPATNMIALLLAQCVKFAVQWVGTNTRYEICLGSSTLKLPCSIRSAHYQGALIGSTLSTGMLCILPSTTKITYNEIAARASL